MTETADAGRTDRGDRDDRTVTVRLPVAGMDCPSCAGEVETSLERVNGVASLGADGSAAMVDDGISDSRALAAANVGIDGGARGDG